MSQNHQHYLPPQGGAYPPASSQQQQQPPPHQQYGGYPQHQQQHQGGHYQQSYAGQQQHQQYASASGYPPHAAAAQQQQAGAAYYGQQQQQQQARAPPLDPLQQLQQHYASYQQQSTPYQPHHQHQQHLPRGGGAGGYQLSTPYGGAPQSASYGAQGSYGGQQEQGGSSYRGGVGNSNYRGRGGGGGYGGYPNGAPPPSGGAYGGYGQSSYAPRDGGYQPRDGGYQPRGDGGYVPRGGRGRGGFDDRGGYRGSGGGYRGGRGNGGGFGAGHFGGKELNFIIHVNSFEALNLLGRSTDIFGAVSSMAQQKIQKALRGADLEVHILFLVEGRYLGGFSSRHSRQTIILPQALSTSYGDMREATTDQGAPLFGSTQDGDALPRHYYLSLRQIVQDIQGMVSAGKTVSQLLQKSTTATDNVVTDDDEGGDQPEAPQQPEVDIAPSTVEELLQLSAADAVRLIPQSLQTLELLLQVVAESGKGSSSSPGSAFLFQLIEHDPHFLFCTAGMKLLHGLLSWQTLRTQFFDLIEKLTNSWVDEVVEPTTNNDAAPAASSSTIDPTTTTAQSSSSTTTRNILESKGYGLFKQLLIHPFSGPLALQLFGLLPLTLKTEDGQERARTAAESSNEVRVFCKAFEIFGFEAVCGNLGGATLAALLGRFTEQASTASASNNNNNFNNGRKRGREDDGADKREESPQVLADRVQLVRAAAVAFTAGIDTGNHEVRISALARHVLACRSVQCIIRGFLDVIVNDPASPLKPFHEMTASEKISVAGRASTFVECMCRSAASLMIDNYGNYVMQTLATDSFEFMASSSSSPQSAKFLMTLLKLLLGNVEGSFWEIATNKCGSNCIEKLVIATEKLTSGGSPSPNSQGGDADAEQIQTFGALAIVSLSECLARLGPQSYGQLFVHAFGNYAVRQLLQRLSAISTRSDDAALRSRALFCEVTFYKTLYSMMPNMEGNMYATGVRSWFGLHSARLNAAATSSASTRQ
ncbi:Hypothetical protein, putative [Bodo saltans]|uniref:Uncharacterized protein n=1 Tax=Bodo saltans TaxID=75058 RepID=A0A0S4JPF9_BODSA|nr:Hypothetical protein, putative [Bodo saltans]|eukprot:CUG92054.1 Hypothetical protein, putative [Bodo saltans]